MNNGAPCIYCKKSNTPKNVEHVLPKMLGKFENNLTLIGMVCQECNQFFSKDIELALGRDSIYGILYRGLVGLLNNKKFNKAVKHQRKYMAPLLYHTDYGHLHIDLSLNKETVFKAEIANQFSILNSTKGRRVNIRVDQLPPFSQLDSIGLPPKKGRFMFLGKTNEKHDYEELSRILKLCNINLTLGQEILLADQLPEQGPLLFSSMINDTIIRAVAKIGFNYLAYRIGSSLSLNESFNEIRNYVLNGVNTNHKLVVLSHKELRYNVQNLKPEIFGLHNIQILQEGHSIYALITLFNHAVFEVLLSNSFKTYSPSLNGHSTFHILDKSITHENKQLSGLILPPF